MAELTLYRTSLYYFSMTENNSNDYLVEFSVVVNARCKSLSRVFDYFMKNDEIEFKSLRLITCTSSFYDVVCPEIERIDNIIDTRFHGEKLLHYAVKRNSRGGFSMFVSRNRLTRIEKIGNTYQVKIEKKVTKDDEHCEGTEKEEVC